MNRTHRFLTIWGAAAITLVLAVTNGFASEEDSRTWLEAWRRDNPQWRALHLIGPQPQRLDVTRELITTLMVPNRMNVLVLEVNYGFRYQSHPELKCSGLDKAQARELTAFCREHGIRLIPLFNCLGHQSWATRTAALLKTYPQFDETPHIPADNKGIYCREWCPSLPQVDKLVFDLLDELLEAFDADALHVGMDEVFLIGDEKCPRCRGKDKGDLLAGVVNRLHNHLVKDKQVEILMWGDRLLDAAVFPYGAWEASRTGSHRALEQIPKDIIVCDWHYELREDYPSVRFLQEQGFRVLPCPWKNPDAAVALIRCARKDATEKMLGVLFTGWSAGGNGEHLLSVWKNGSQQAKPQETARGIAAAIRAGLPELDR